MSEDRWWFATVWLWLCLVANALTLFGIVHILTKQPAAISTLTILRLYFVIGPLAQIACIVALFRWRRWGWYGLVGIGVITFGANIARGTNVFACVLGLAGAAITFVILQGGGEQKAWPRLF